MRIESNEFCVLGVVEDTVDAALLAFWAAVGLRREAVRRRDESGIVKKRC